MRKACVMGFPVAHSLSPRLHRYWLDKYAIEGQYEAWEVPPENLGEAMQRLRDRGYIGANLTLPHKELVLPMLSSMDEQTRRIGAANTLLVLADGSVHGKNTDAFGFMENIRAHAGLAHKNKAVVLGAGGAARAVVMALCDEGFAQVVVCNRTPKNAEALAEAFPRVTVCSWDDRENALRDADLLVNTTCLGMQGKEALSLSLENLPAHAVVNDIVYAPLETPLLALARRRGHAAIDGLGMLIYQAAAAFEAWHGVRPEVDDGLRRALLS